MYLLGTCFEKGSLWYSFFHMQVICMTEEVWKFRTVPLLMSPIRFWLLDVADSTPDPPPPIHTHIENSANLCMPFHKSYWVQLSVSKHRIAAKQASSTSISGSTRSVLPLQQQHMQQACQCAWLAIARMSMPPECPATAGQAARRCMRAGRASFWWKWCHWYRIYPAWPWHSSLGPLGCVAAKELAYI